jgi:putative SOS response-associated peptidase YedK
MPPRRLRQLLAAMDRCCETKADPVEGERLLFSSLTSEPNGVVGPIHPKVMPVVLTMSEEYDVWLYAPTKEALKLQRPFPDNMLRNIEGEKSNRPEV